MKHVPGQESALKTATISNDFMLKHKEIEAVIMRNTEADALR